MEKLLLQSFSKPLSNKLNEIQYFAVFREKCKGVKTFAV